MKLFRMDVHIVGTAYAMADSPEEAAAKIATFAGKHLGLDEDEEGDVAISDRPYDDPRLPPLSLSPAMTIQGIEPGAKAEPAETE
jgi:hypothetical protein